MLISVKFGVLRGPDNAWNGHDARPAAVKNFLAYTLQRLGTDHVDIYRPARLDPAVPIEDTIGAIGDLVKAGYVRHVGLSEIGADTIRRAAAVHPIVDLQIEYSLISRGIEAEILPACRELGIAITAYGVLARGLISGHWSKERGGRAPTSATAARASRRTISTTTWRSSKRCARSAEKLGATVAQIAIAWVLARGDDIVPLVGARRRNRLSEALGALDLKLDGRRSRRHRVAQSRPARQPASATIRARWRCSTAKAAAARPPVRRGSGA